MASQKLRKIFIVDDDPALSEMLKDHLEDNLYVQITMFKTGEDCLASLDAKPDLIVLDYNLNSVDKSAKNGVEILQEIKTTDPNIQVVMLSGQDKIDVAVETMRHGAFDYVIKNESAFKRTENVAYNVFQNFRLKEMLKIYKTGFYVLAIGISVIIVAAIILKITGVATDNVNWL